MKHATVNFLEGLGQVIWPSDVVEEIAGWRLGLDAGVTRRANSTLPGAWTGDRSLAGDLGAVEARYRRAGLPPCFKLTRAAQPSGLAKTLEQRGYQEEGHSRVLSAAANDFAALPPAPAITVSLENEASDDWCRTALAERPPGRDFAACAAIVRRIAADRQFATARIEGETAGAALAVFDQGWTGITAVHTWPTFRRRGVARALFTALTGWAQDRGCQNFTIQVEVENQPAELLYRSLGFRPAYRYHYAVLKD